MAFESEPLPYIGFGIPSTIVFLIGNVLTQYPFTILLCNYLMSILSLANIGNKTIFYSLRSGVFLSC